VTPLPFYFRELPSTGQVLISNLLGAHAVLSSRSELEAVAIGDISRLPTLLAAELVAKSFVSNPTELMARASLLASGLTTSIARATTGPNLFMVVPTLRCDHDCRYCQVSRAPLTAAGYDADMDRIPGILRHIDATAGKSLKIEFQGGEPLLAFDFIQRFVEQADRTLANRHVTYVICSALGPLSETVIQWARTRPVTFSVSLDGGSKTHDSNRPSRYFNSYQHAKAGIIRLGTELGPDRVSCVATVSRVTLENPADLVDTYFDLGLESMFVRPISPFGFATRLKGTMAYRVGDYLEFFDQMMDAVLAKNQERMFIEESTLIRLRRIYDPGFAGYVDMQSPAGYLFGALVFNYDGRIFGSDEARMLWESTKSDHLVLGFVDDQPEIVVSNGAAAVVLEDSFTCASPGCDECAYQPFCGADPLHHLATQGDHVGDKSISFFCQLQRQMFDQLFVWLNGRPEARRVFETWLVR
jgi:His-Xaa-Ser system radical SAM maturase HxsB